MIRLIISNFAVVIRITLKFTTLIILLLIYNSTGSIAQFTIKVTIQETLISELLKHLETLLIRLSF